MSERRLGTAAPLHELFERRYSPRAFADEPIGDGALRAMLEAARWAPSCFNEQPWTYLVAKREDRAEFARMAGCLNERNRAWAAEAPMLMVSIARTTFRRNGKPNRHAWHDVGLASACLTLQATALGLAVHQMAGFDRERVRETYGVPDGEEPVAMLAVGRPGDPETLPPDLAERERAPRTRKPLAGVAYRGAWGRKLLADDAG